MRSEIVCDYGMQTLQAALPLETRDPNGWFGNVRLDDPTEMER